MYEHNRYRYQPPDETALIPARHIEARVVHGKTSKRAKRRRSVKRTALAVVAVVVAFLVMAGSFGFALLHLPYNR